MIKFIVINKGTRKRTILFAKNSYEAKWFVAKSKKKISGYTCELYIDHNQLQEQNISVLGYRTFGNIPEDRETVRQIDGQLRLIGQSIGNFRNLEGLPTLVKLGGES